MLSTVWIQDWCIWTDMHSSVAENYLNLNRVIFWSVALIVLTQVYRHTFWKFRREHHRTRIGEPPPYGLPGFNSGVLLLDLKRMRQSSLYNSLLDAAEIARLSDELHFKGHLGDQDFFTLVGTRYEQLFYVLPCQWNRQLCRWWEENGYKDVFESYHRCDGDIMVYHGNCNTPIPWCAFGVFNCLLYWLLIFSVSV